MLKISILGTGRSVPVQSLHSSEIDRKLGLKNVISSVGVHRRFVCDRETQIDLATAACGIALEEAGLTAGDIDLIISASSVAYQPIPSTAPLIMRSLGIPDGTATAFDVNSTCLSFVSGLEVAARMIDGRAARTALVVSSELASRGLPWDEQPEVAALFGDGAAAAVVGAAARGECSQIRAIGLRSYPSAYEACGIGAGGTRFDLNADHAAFVEHARFRMDGKALFRLASQHFKGFVEDFLTQAGWHRSDVDLVVPHQASPAGLEHMIRQAGFDRDRVVNVVCEYGNQIAASIPFAFDIARKEGRIKQGSKVLLLGTSAGVGFGGAALVI